MAMNALHKCTDLSGMLSVMSHKAGNNMIDLQWWLDSVSPVLDARGAIPQVVACAITRNVCSWYAPDAEVHMKNCNRMHILITGVSHPAYRMVLIEVRCMLYLRDLLLAFLQHSRPCPQDQVNKHTL